MFPSHVMHSGLSLSRKRSSWGSGWLSPAWLAGILAVQVAAQDDTRRHPMQRGDATRTASDESEWGDDLRDESGDGDVIDDDSTFDSDGIAGEDPPPDAPTTVDAVCFSGPTATATLCSQHSECPAGQACRLKSRFLSIDPSPGVYALQVTVTAVPNAPVAVNQPPYNYPNMVGDVWWVGPPMTRTDDQTPYVTAPLECTGAPHVQDWSGSGPINIYGEAVVPRARYEIRACAGPSGPCSAPLSLSTTRGGDIRDSFDLVNFGDIAASVNEFTSPNDPAGSKKPHAWLAPSLIALGTPYGFNQVAACVTNFSGGPPPAPALDANQCP